MRVYVYAHDHYSSGFLSSNPKSVEHNWHAHPFIHIIPVKMAPKKRVSKIEIKTNNTLAKWIIHAIVTLKMFIYQTTGWYIIIRPSVLWHGAKNEKKIEEEKAREKKMYHFSYVSHAVSTNKNMHSFSIESIQHIYSMFWIGDFALLGWWLWFSLFILFFFYIYFSLFFFIQAATCLSPFFSSLLLLQFLKMFISIQFVPFFKLEQRNKHNQL